MHLTAEQLVDIAEGAASEGQAPALSEVEGHLLSCAACRAQLADLRAMMAAAADVDVPEPSPLFWDHLSARISNAVDAEPPISGWNWWLRAALPFVLATAAAVAIAAVMTTRLIAPHAEPASTAAFRAAPPATATPARETLAPDVTDPSLSLVADLSQDLNWDDTRAAGLAPRGSADHAVTHMSEEEIRQLRDLLKEEMANSGD